MTLGASPAAEIFHEEVRKKLAKAGILVIKNIHDDILVGGEGTKSHKENLKATFEICRAHNITLNLKKCEFGKTSVKFFGLRFSENGIHPDPEKVNSLRNADAPKDKSELRSFLGMSNFSARFIKNYSTLTYELRKLMKADVPWEWGEKQQKAFDILRNQLCENSVLNHFDLTANSEIICDASPVGLSAILVQYDISDDQKEHPRIISYSSKSLTPTQKRYSQIEKEALAISFGCIKYEMFVLGQYFTVVTDHRPLVSLFNSPSRPGPFRVERLRLKLQGFKFNVIYKPGKTNPSDYLSRHPEPVENPPPEHEENPDELECHVINVIRSSSASVPCALSLEEIQLETKADQALNKILHGLKSGNLDKHSIKQDEDLRDYAKVIDEFSVTQDIILRRDRIVLPKSLIKKVLRIGHEGHQGVVKTKQFLRSIVWFLSMDSIIEKYISKCISCQASVNTPVQEPVKSTELPDYPWQRISVDFLGPLPSGHYIMVAIDEYSRFPEVFITTSTALKPTISNLDKLFSSYGIPEVVKTDNGPPFNSKGFKCYSKHMGFRHRRVTPLHPRANG